MSNKVKIPGKVMLSGEYAVLYGATAALLPVPRFLKIRETNTSPKGSYSKVVIVAIDYPVPEIAEYEDEFGLPNLSIDYREFFSADKEGKSTKLGLGCSAAEAVGVVSLRFQRAGKPYLQYKDEIFNYAIKIHNIAQSGLGSGADVAVCAYDKPIKFKIGASSFNPDVIGLDSTTERVKLKLVWTGQPADTRSMVKKFQHYYSKDRNTAGDDLNELIELNDNLANAWFSYTLRELYELLDEHDYAMQKCTSPAGVSYKLPIHEQFQEWAKRHNGRAKPTGAGGGDMILLVGDLPLQEIDQLIIPL